MSNFECKLRVKPHTVYQKKSYLIPLSKRQAAEEEVKTMLQLGGIIESSTTEYSSPIVCVTKNSGAVRLCLDARNLNKILVNDRESPPHIEELLQRIHGTYIYSVADLSAGYWQIKIDKDSRDYLSFSFNGRNYRFRCLPFGLVSSMAIFMKCMTEVLNELLEYCIIYVDDITIASKTVEEHCKQLDKNFQRLISRGLTIKISKCSLFQNSVKFLGTIINKNGIQQDPEKLAVIRNFPSPSNRKQ